MLGVPHFFYDYAPDTAPIPPISVNYCKLFIFGQRLKICITLSRNPWTTYIFQSVRIVRQTACTHDQAGDWRSDHLMKQSNVPLYITFHCMCLLHRVRVAYVGDWVVNWPSIVAAERRGVRVATLTVAAADAGHNADDVGDSETLCCIVVAIATRRISQRCFLLTSQHRLFTASPTWCCFCSRTLHTELYRKNCRVTDYFDHTILVSMDVNYGVGLTLGFWAPASLEKDIGTAIFNALLFAAFTMTYSSCIWWNMCSLTKFRIQMPFLWFRFN